MRLYRQLNSDSNERALVYIATGEGYRAVYRNFFGWWCGAALHWKKCRCCGSVKPNCGTGICGVKRFTFSFLELTACKMHRTKSL